MVKVVANFLPNFLTITISNVIDDRISNIVVKRDTENGENEAHIPGMAFTHFTRTGKYSIHFMFQWLNSV